MRYASLRRRQDAGSDRKTAGEARGANSEARPLQPREHPRRDGDATGNGDCGLELEHLGLECIKLTMSTSGLEFIAARGHGVRVGVGAGRRDRVGAEVDLLVHCAHDLRVEGVAHCRAHVYKIMNESRHREPVVLGIILARRVEMRDLVYARGILRGDTHRGGDLFRLALVEVVRHNIRGHAEQIVKHRDRAVRVGHGGSRTPESPRVLSRLTRVARTREDSASPWVHTKKFPGTERLFNVLLQLRERGAGDVAERVGGLSNATYALCHVRLEEPASLCSTDRLAQAVRSAVIGQAVGQHVVEGAA
mmetsp:Transcript_37018/g.101884  ORF Transcript_37018/g.101884 Transcript_37018/m.101884 type:complete len:306 (+) Transcript_37018:31-948(+)